MLYFRCRLILETSSRREEQKYNIQMIILTGSREHNHLDVEFPVPLDFGNFLQERGADCLFCSVKEKALLFYNVAVYQLRIHTLLQKE